MKFLISEIKKNAVDGSFTFDKMDVDVSELASLESNDIREIKPVHVSGDCVIDGDEFIFTLNISGEMILPCARTLADVPYSFQINEVEVFSESPYYGEKETENEIFPVQGEVIDLLPCIEENILLAVPFRVFSKDKKVLDQALTKGEGWDLTLEDELEEEVEEQIDPRMKKLQSLLDDKEDK